MATVVGEAPRVLGFSWSRTAWRLAVLTVVYFAAGKLGLLLAFVHESATPVWPPTGIALAALLLYGYRMWPAIFVGAFLVNVTTAGSIATSLGIATGNTLEGVLGVWLVRRWAGGPAVFARAQTVFAFAGLACVVAPAVSASVGVASLVLGGQAQSGLGEIWLTWWLGDMAGALVVTPVIYLWAAEPRARPARRELLELGLVLAAALVVGLVVFGRLGPAAMNGHPIEFLCIPPLVYAAFRFGQREAATCVALLAALAIWGTLTGEGPFAHESANVSLLLLQAFLMTLMIVTLPLAAVLREHAQSKAVLANTAAIVASSDDAIIGKTLDGVMTSWNEGAERLYGYTAAEAIGRPISLIIPGELRHELPAILDKLSGGVRIEHFETTRVAKTGRRIDVSVTISPVRDPSDRIIGASSIARDITHRKRMEATTRERDTLRSVASLAAGAAHEINNPLAVVLGQVQLLASELEGAQRQRIAEILEAIDRIRAIVARMRHLTHVELSEPYPGLPEMLDLARSSETAPPRVDTLVIVAREGPARYEALHTMFAGGGTEVIFDRRKGERRRSGPGASGGRRREDRRRRDVSAELRARGWTLVLR
ncbi:MAG TPA: MASE1 domain-containing protein [Methylomirabilota bacterium]|nr:MASE1 domain-containing protein [Methylomirabilota bacterium]